MLTALLKRANIEFRVIADAQGVDYILSAHDVTLRHVPATGELRLSGAGAETFLCDFLRASQRTPFDRAREGAEILTGFELYCYRPAEGGYCTAIRLSSSGAPDDEGHISPRFHSFMRALECFFSYEQAAMKVVGKATLDTLADIVKQEHN